MRDSCVGLVGLLGARVCLRLGAVVGASERADDEAKMLLVGDKDALSGERGACLAATSILGEGIL